MKIGLFFGSFNPIHVGHLIIANFVVSLDKVDKVWLILTPQNPLKSQKKLLNEYDRKYLIDIALDGEPKLKCSTIEFSLPKPSYTIDTLIYLKERYPDNSFTIIIGSDSYKNINNWKNSKMLLNEYPFLVYIRPGFEIDTEINKNIEVVNAPLLNISSTMIRERIKNGKSIRFFVPDKVNDEIVKNNYYRKKPA